MAAIYLDVTAEQLTRHSVLQSYMTIQPEETVAAQPYIRLCMQSVSEEQLQRQLIQLILDESVSWVLQHHRQNCSLLKDKGDRALIMQRVQQRVAQMQSQLEVFIHHDMELLYGPLSRTNDDAHLSSWNLDGYLRFSAKKVKWVLETILYEEVQTFQEEQERQEFIALLQFCVAVQPTLLDDVYLTLQANQFTMVDLWGNDLQQIYLEALPKEEYADVQMHDLILSILMTMLPQTIHLFINTEQMNAEQLAQQKKLVQLLQQIFPGRLLVERE